MTTDASNIGLGAVLEAEARRNVEAGSFLE